MFYATTTRRYKGNYICRAVQFPKKVGRGATREMAQDDLKEQIKFLFMQYVKTRRDLSPTVQFPYPESVYEPDGVEFGLVLCAKIALLNASIRHGHLTMLSRQHFLDLYSAEVYRLYDINVNNRIETLEAALAKYQVRIALREVRYIL